jgi:hypothetical protein
VQSLTVLDGNAKRVGNVLGFGPAAGVATVSFRVNGELVVISVNHDGFTINSSFTNGPGSLIFESTNCMGTAFAVFGPPGPSLAPLHLLSGTLLYAWDGPQTTIIEKSQLDNGICQTEGPGQTVGTPLRLVIDLSTQFKPPFTMK